MIILNLLKNKSDVEKWYKKMTKEVFKEHRKEVYNRFSCNVPYPSLTIRKMTTRWGVCNTRKHNITLNSELFRYDLECLDYVVIHELSHFIEGNHSKKFWNVVEKYCPNYKEIKKKLKE